MDCDFKETDAYVYSADGEKLRRQKRRRNLESMRTLSRRSRFRFHVQVRYVSRTRRSFIL